jgi:sec-independent protein translocase protein TatA
MFGLGTQELMVVLVIVVILFGASKLPQIGSGMGQAIRNFKKSVAEADAEEKQQKKDVIAKENE